MTTIFRRRIMYKVLSAINAFIDGPNQLKLTYQIPPALRYRKRKNDPEPPRFQLMWKELCKLEPELEKRIHPESLLTCLQNQDWPLSEGISNVRMQNDPHQSYIFDVDQEMFARKVLLEMFCNIEELCDRSSFFQPVPLENVIVEFSSPNIAKPFHFGHFRSTIIGNSLANLFKFMGHTVTRMNYVGDWGLQYGILATGYSEFGVQEELQTDPLLHLHGVYKEANVRNTDDPVFREKARKHFQEMEEGGEEVLKQWRLFRDISLEKMEETYKRLGVQFDETHGESMYADKTNDILLQLVKKSIAANESDGSIHVMVPRGNETDEKVMLRKSDGTSLYITRDVAAAIDRRNSHHFDSMYYVVDSTQSKHFSDLFHLIKCLGHSWHSNLRHVPFGRILNFSTRKGNAVFLHDILNEARERTLERMKASPTTKVTENIEEVADILGISSLVVNDLSERRRKNYEFDWDAVLNMKGNSGVTLQYCHARLNNLKENCGVELKLTCDFNLLTETVAVELIDLIARFDEALYYTYTELDPYVLVRYLFSLRQAVGRANRVLTVKGQPLDIARARLLMFQSAQQVLHKGLSILGIKPLNRM